jgi:lipopolysaccharide biosynthesis regulator YciM
LASSFLHQGKHNKAISVYLALLEHVKEPVKKEELLGLLGDSYFKSGMLQRGKDIYLKILKFNPRNKKALHTLLLIFQNLKEYNKALEVLDALEELDEDTIKERIYLKVLTIINDPFLSFEKKSVALYDSFQQNKRLERVVCAFLVKFNKKLLWDKIDNFNPLNIIDFLWYLDFDDIDWEVIHNNKLLEDIYSAKGYISSSKQSDNFELNVLIAMQNSTTKSNLDLNFEFICSKCKKMHPIFESRCPHCNSILSFMVEPKLGRPTINLSSLV